MYGHSLTKDAEGKLEADRKRQQRRRCSASQEDKVARLATARAREHARRSSESAEARHARLAADRARHQQRRAMESVSQRTGRLTADRARKQKCRDEQRQRREKERASREEQQRQQRVRQEQLREVSKRKDINGIPFWQSEETIITPKGFPFGSHRYYTVPRCRRPSETIDQYMARAIEMTVEQRRHARDKVEFNRTHPTTQVGGDIEFRKWRESLPPRPELGISTPSEEEIASVVDLGIRQGHDIYI